MERSNVFGFQAGKKNVLYQGQGSVVYSKIDLYSHVDMIVCNSNWIVMHFTGKECDVSPYTDAYENIKAVSIVQKLTAHKNPETGETTILILNKASCMGETTYHILVNPNQLRAYHMAVKDKSFT